MGKRIFTAEYKTQVVLEVLREEKQLGEIALQIESVPVIHHTER